MDGGMDCAGRHAVVAREALLEGCLAFGPRKIRGRRNLDLHCSARRGGAAQRTGLAAIAFAACGNGTRRHHAYAAAVAGVLRTFPGQPQVRVEVPDMPAAGCRMDLVVTGAWTASAAAGPGGVPDRRTLLVDCMVAEPMGLTALRELKTAEKAGAAAEAGRRSKERRYGHLIADRTRQLLVPWAVETWGRFDPALLLLLQATARLAAFRESGRDSCSSDGAEQRRDARVCSRILRGWLMKLSAGLAVAVACHLDAEFFPVRGTAARSAFRQTAAGGGGTADTGLIGVTGWARNSEPRFSFLL